MSQVGERQKMNQIKERYIAAVLRSIREDRRQDVDRELRAAIDDAIDARIEAGVDPDQAEREVLTEFGDPVRLAADYSDRPQWLIGPEFYQAWLRLTKWLLKALVPAAVVANAGIRLALGSGPVEAVFSGLWLGFIVALNVVFWSTLGFVIAERTDHVDASDIEPLTRWKLEDLPATTAPARHFSLVETVGALIMQLVLVVVLIAMGDSQPDWLSSEWGVALPVMVGLLVASMAFRLVRYRVGRWTTALATANAILNAAFAGWWFWALWNLRVFDPSFAESLGAEDWLTPTARITALVIQGVCAWDAIEGFQGARRAEG